MRIVETLSNMIVSVYVLVGESEHVYRGTMLMQDDTGVIIRTNIAGSQRTKIVFFPADKLLRIEQVD